jgi:hypothetical protein
MVNLFNVRYLFIGSKESKCDEDEELRTARGGRIASIRNKIMQKIGLNPLKF